MQGLTEASCAGCGEDDLVVHHAACGPGSWEGSDRSASIDSAGSKWRARFDEISTERCVQVCWACLLQPS